MTWGDPFFLYIQKRFLTCGKGIKKGTRVYDANAPAITFTSGRHPHEAGGATGLYIRPGSAPRRLTALEAARVMGLDHATMGVMQEEGLLDEEQSMSLVGNAMETRSLMTVLAALLEAMGLGWVVKREGFGGPQ